MQLVDRDDTRALAFPSRQIAGWLYHTDSRNEPHINQEIALSDKTILKIGRDERANSFSIGRDAENYVSRKHCEVYVVLYELGISHVYVRDRKSCNGTYVNGLCIGDSSQTSSGYLLADGDVVEIRPFWQFLFKQKTLAPEEPLNKLQMQESQLFEGKYTILSRVLGAGSQGSVHLAVNTTSKKQLVCKIINMKQAGVRGQQPSPQKILQESDTLRQLKHPNILTYVDTLWSPHTLYIFTELASGGDLLSYINQHDVIPEFDTRIVVRQIARALHWLHDRNIVHRDLKPENVLLACSPRIAYQRVMLSDFGSCALPLSNKLKTNVGTQNFQAPEVLRGEKQTNAADIWPLGVISMLLVTGCGLAGIDGLARLDQMALENVLHDVLANCKEASASAKSFILQCMKIRASDRITSAGAGCHDWFHTPSSHLAFFQALDARTAAL
ncbi:serine/threonine protein kinase, putative [Cordyceps militaris CM01]|uniref:Serine/threonine protein kinase, putative n=1 Tax=Cordyceps militaris (strain CM01) TaxID=983644 RepID=G3JMH8_CORMM|nr:serine/threonine protein kinase, putative [Cordyceps militaris CM01]EGX90857.1 serine/threonine protein kinase, putative [Cordyceps militaris CM01]